MAGQQNSCSHATQVAQTADQSEGEETPCGGAEYQDMRSFLSGHHVLAWRQVAGLQGVVSCHRIELTAFLSSWQSTCGAFAIV